MAVGPKALGLVALGLEVVRFKQHWVHCTDAAETTHVPKTAESNVAKPNVGKLRVRPCHFWQMQQSIKPKNNKTGHVERHTMSASYLSTTDEDTIFQDI